VLRRNDGALRVERHRPSYTEAHLELYNRHAQERGLSLRESAATAADYRFFLVDTCVDTWELRYYAQDRLVAVSVVDVGRSAASSVYHYFDPDESWRSLGVYSVLKEVELCATLGLEWYYLGLYVEACRHLNYKAAYFPHQRRIDGRWQEFHDSALHPVSDETPPAGRR
jgi:arginine-tRNA-protein transferase